MKTNIEIDIKLSPGELATEFADLGADEQALFFTALAMITEEWTGGMAMQLQSITDSDKLTDDARVVMRMIGDYADKEYGG